MQDLQSVLIIPLKYPQAVVDNGNLTRMDDRFADEAVELIQRQFPLQSLLPEIMGILIIFPNRRGHHIVCLEDGEDITENIGDRQNLINGLFHAASGGEEMAEVAAAYTDVQNLRRNIIQHGLQMLQLALSLGKGQQRRVFQHRHHIKGLGAILIGPLQCVEIGFPVLQGKLRENKTGKQLCCAAKLL